MEKSRALELIGRSKAVWGAEDVEAARALGWNPEPVKAEIDHLPCVGGCGRSANYYPEDARRFYLCQLCAASLAGFANKVLGRGIFAKRVSRGAKVGCIDQ
tara:strand:- start:626 stop:928 length:303 start_codon:yes stop_codon:yes gene_type:complete